MSNLGDLFEKTVFNWLQEEVGTGSYGLDPCNTRLLRKPAYWSRDRESEIIFDISIEVSRRESDSPYLIWIWECKNYSHPVPIDDLEEFHTKLQQIGSDRTKGTLVTTSSFQRSSLKFAEAHGIGLIRMRGKRDAIHIRDLLPGAELRTLSPDTDIILALTSYAPGRIDDASHAYVQFNTGKFGSFRCLREYIKHEFDSYA